jgi:tetratricopeptide (TPR) repeat protein
VRPPDNHHLAAASGWLDLGLVDEAIAELAKISPANRSHFQVLEIRWEIHSKTGDWQSAHAVAKDLVEMDKESAGACLHLAYATRRIPSGGLQAAWNILLPAVDQFPGEPIIPFNLACYAAQMNRLTEAWAWFQEAVKRSDDRKQIIQMATNDRDLEPLWERIQKEYGRGQSLK